VLKAKEKLFKMIQELDDDIAEKLLEKVDDLLL